MEFINDAVEKVKEVAGTAYKITEGAVITQKQKLDIASLEHKLNKEYTLLGKTYYRFVKSENGDTEELDKIIESVSEKIAEIKEAKKELAEMKNRRICPECGKHVDSDSAYCNYCGKKFD